MPPLYVTYECLSGPSAFTPVVHLGTVDQVLLAELDQLPGLLEVLALQGSDRAECPARAARPL